MVQGQGIQNSPIARSFPTNPDTATLVEDFNNSSSSFIALNESLSSCNEEALRHYAKWVELSDQIQQIEGTFLTDHDWKAEGNPNRNMVLAIMVTCLTSDEEYQAKKDEREEVLDQYTRAKVRVQQTENMIELTRSRMNLAGALASILQPATRQLT